MCGTCGCGGDEARIEGPMPASGAHRHDHGAGHEHGLRDHDHDHDHDDTRGRVLRIEADLLAKNAGHAAANRAGLAARGVLALNLVSSPGSGKTSLLVRTLSLLEPAVPVAVIEGDQQTSRDADRIRAAGAPAVQINTGRGCHLDAHMVGHAIERLAPPEGGVLFIENVGNLVCPAGFDLGEAHRVVILSVTEGEDKPLKYPDIFATSDLVLVTKTDLLPHLDYDRDEAMRNLARVTPRARVLWLSARTGEGLQAWMDWLAGARQMALAARPAASARG